MSTYRDIIQGLLNGVRSITPQSYSDVPFSCGEDQSGGLLSPEDWIFDPHRRTRDFDIRATGLSRKLPGCHMASDAEIRIVYDLRTNLAELDVVIQEDLQSIYDRVLHTTTWWGAHALTVFQPDGAAPIIEEVEDGDDIPVRWVVQVPIEIHYIRRAP